MRRIIGVCVATLAISGCNRTLNDAHRTVALGLKDPSSARFTNEVIGKNKSVCGFVDGKNGFGAYGGASPYMYEGLSKTVYLYGDNLKSTQIDSLLSQYTSKEDFSEIDAKISNDCVMIDNWETECPQPEANMFADKKHFCEVFKKGFSSWKELGNDPT